MAQGGVHALEAWVFELDFCLFVCLMKTAVGKGQRATVDSLKEEKMSYSFCKRLWLSYGQGGS